MKKLITSKTILSALAHLNSQNNTGKTEIPHCVNPKCPYFHNSNPHDSSWYKNHGHYETTAFSTVQRFRCNHCGKTFSTQSFSIDYYVKQPVDYYELIKSLVSTTGMGNMTRFLGLRHECIQNRYERLSRSLLALHSNMRDKIQMNEDFALDGFESFSMSQYYPNNVNIIAGSSSEFIYGLGFSQLRRKGQMTTKQRCKRNIMESEYGKAPPDAVEKSVASLLNNLCKLLHSKDLEKKILHTDEHKAYTRAFKKTPGCAEVLVHKQTSSKAARNAVNPLFPDNYIDRQIRKDQINHVRETVQFARCPAAMMTRLCIYQMFHNYMMPRRVKQQRKGNWETRGEMLGIEKEEILTAMVQVCSKRVFYNKCNLWKEEQKTWLMTWQNSNIKIGRRIPLYIYN